MFQLVGCEILRKNCAPEKEQIPPKDFSVIPYLGVSHLFFLMDHFLELRLA